MAGASMVKGKELLCTDSEHMAPAPAPPLHSCMTPGKLLLVSGPQFPLYEMKMPSDFRVF